MAVLTVTILSVIAHLALGQGWGHVGAMPGGWGMDAGWGKDMHSGWGKDEGAGWGKDMHQGWGKGWGMGKPTGWGKGWEEKKDSTTITCTFEESDIVGALTLRNSEKKTGGWGWGQTKKDVSGSLEIITGKLSGTFKLVFTELSRVEGGCTTEGLGHVIAKTKKTMGGWGRPMGGWGHPMGGWGSSWDSDASGVVKTIQITDDQQAVIDLHSNLPLDELKEYAGRGFAICSDVTTDHDYKEECIEPVACCKLGFDNMEATPPESHEYYKK